MCHRPINPRDLYPERHDEEEEQNQDSIKGHNHSS